MDLSDRVVTLQPRSPARRAFVCGAIATAATAFTAPARAHNSAGIVKPPEAPPPVALMMDSDRQTTLEQELRGRVTALQLMFTRCQATCPIQGAIFGQSAKALADQVSDAQWLSVSIDPGNDDPKALHQWLMRFGAHPRWHAGRPAPDQLDPLVDFLKARNSGADRHTAQVFFFDRRGELAMRSVDFPPVAEIVRVLKELAAQK
jgi:protein SCO1/2